MAVHEYFLSPYKRKRLSLLVSTGELLDASLKDFSVIEVRCTAAHAAGMKGAWREEGSESAGSNKQPSPILKGQKSWKSFIGTIKKT